MKDKIERLKRILRVERELAKERECLNQEISVEIQKLTDSGREVGFRIERDGPVQYGKIISHYSKHRMVSVKTEAGLWCIKYNDLIF